MGELMKKRNLTAIIEIKEEVQIAWNEIEKCFELRNSEGELTEKSLISIGESYNREGKLPKILRQFKCPLNGKISFDPKNVLYDRYFAIDTSYVPYGNNLICATSALSLEQHVNNGRLDKGEQIRTLQSPRPIFLAKSNSKPERYGWMKMIEAFLRYEAYNKEWSYGVIVDSDLDDLPKINAREEPIIDNFYLPHNMTLIYASADVGKESFLNKFIKATDCIANKTLKSALELYGNQTHIDINQDYLDMAVMNDPIKITIF